MMTVLLYAVIFAGGFYFGAMVMSILAMNGTIARDEEIAALRGDHNVR